LTTPSHDAAEPEREAARPSGPPPAAASSRTPISPTTQIFVGLLFAYLGLGMVVPVMAPLTRKLGLSEMQAGLIFAVNYLMWVLASPFWGSRTEIWGRKPVILLGLGGFALGHLLFGLVAEVGLFGWMTGIPLLILLILTRAFAGALFSGAPPAAQAYVVDTVAARNRTQAVGLLGAAAGMGTVAGPIASVITSGLELDLTWSLFGAALLPMPPLILLWLFLPRGVVREHADPPKLAAWDRRVVGVLTIGLVMNVAVALLLFTLGFYIQDRLSLDEHETTFKSGIAMAVVGGIAVLVQGGLLRVLRWSPVTLMRVGLVVMATGMALLLATFGNEWLIYLAVAVFGCGYAFTYPGFQSTITYAVSENEQGSVAGLAAGAGAVAFIIGPVAGTILYGWYEEAPYIVSAVLLVLTALLAVFHPRMQRLRRVAKGLDGGSAP